MPAKSTAQRNLMQAALHGAQFAKAKAIRKSMTPEQIGEFAHTTNRVIRNTTDMHPPSRTRPGADGAKKGPSR